MCRRLEVMQEVNKKQINPFKLDEVISVYELQHDHPMEIFVLNSHISMADISSCGTSVATIYCFIWNWCAKIVIFLNFELFASRASNIRGESKWSECWFVFSFLLFSFFYLFVGLSCPVLPFAISSSSILYFLSSVVLQHRY